MIRKGICVVLMLSGVAWVTATNAASLERGKALYENHCVGCHEDTVHRREAHKARNLAEVQEYVARWEKEMGLKWGDEERADVASYVNSKFYNY